MSVMSFAISASKSPKKYDRRIFWMSSFFIAVTEMNMRYLRYYEVSAMNDFKLQTV